MKRKIMLRPEPIRELEKYIDFNSRIEQIVIIHVAGVEVTCIVKPIAPVVPIKDVPVQLPLFSQNASLKYD